MDRNDPKDNRLREQITTEAAEWFAKLNDPEVPAAEREEFTQWLLRSPAHIEEYLAITRVWGDVGTASEQSVEELVRQARAEPAPDNVVALASLSTATERERPQEGTSIGAAQRSRTRIVAAALAATLALAVIGWFTTDAWLHPSRITTAIGEQRSVTLSDGSVVHLNTDSEVRIDLEEHERRVTLERGEARFTVAKDKTRPFLVMTRQATVRAVGTVFNVQASSDRTAVTVIEGRVAFRSRAERDNPEAARAMEALPSISTTLLIPHSPVRAVRELELGAGQEATATEAGELLPNVGPSVERALAWSERRLVFRDELLTDVIAEFNRYHERPIRIEDPALAAIRISGTFDASDPDSLIEYLEHYENVKTSREPDGTQVVTR